MSFAKIWCLCFFAIFLITGIQCFFQTSLGAALRVTQIKMSKNTKKLRVSWAFHRIPHVILFKSSCCLNHPLEKYAATQNWVHLPQINQKTFFSNINTCDNFSAIADGWQSHQLDTTKTPPETKHKNLRRVELCKTCPRAPDALNGTGLFTYIWVVLRGKWGKCR